MAGIADIAMAFSKIPISAQVSFLLYTGFRANYHRVSVHHFLSVRRAPNGIIIFANPISDIRLWEDYDAKRQKFVEFPWIKAFCRRWSRRRHPDAGRTVDEVAAAVTMDKYKSWGGYDRFIKHNVRAMYNLIQLNRRGNPRPRR